MIFLFSIAETAAGSIDVTPIIVAVVVSIASAAGGAMLTRRSTNKQLSAQGDLLYQQALKVAEERGDAAVATVDRVRRILEERLTEAEDQLRSAREQLRMMEDKLRLSESERKGLGTQFELERDALKHRVAELEREVRDLRDQKPGRRHSDKP